MLTDWTGHFFFFDFHFRVCWGTEPYVALPDNKYLLHFLVLLLPYFSPLSSISSLLLGDSSFASRQVLRLLRHCCVP